MKKVLIVAALLAVLGLFHNTFALEVDLNTYLGLIKVADGNTVDQKIDSLTNIGITLSAQGLRELQQATAASKYQSPPSYTYPAPPSVAPVVPVVPVYGGSESSGTATRLGRTTFYNFENGTSGTATQLGGTTFYNFSDGTSGTANRIGGTTFYNDNNGLSGTTTKIGQFDYHNLNNGVTGTSTTIGNFTFHNFSNGQNCTTTRIGTQTFTNCN